MDSVADAFESAWKRQQRPSVAEFAARVAPAARLQLLRELVRLDWAYRSRMGEAPALQDYLDRFPELTPAVTGSCQAGAYSESWSEFVARCGAGAGESDRTIGGRDTSNSDLRVGMSVGAYRLTRKLGEGGMGEVWSAHDRLLDREVAIKVLKRSGLKDASAQRLLREAKAAASLNHPNAISILHVLEHEREVFIVMELLGASLAEELRTGGAPHWRRATQAIRDAAAGLAAAHARGLVHRDVKPSNLLRHAGSGSIKVADFGLVHSLDNSSTELTVAGVLVGTPLYMSPEVWAGGAADARSDVYALGCTYFELLTGQRPFEAPSPVQVMERHRNEKLPDVRMTVKDVPDDVVRIVFRAAEKAPDKRYQDAGEMLADLDRVLATAEKDPKSLRIVLLYKRNVEPDVQLLALLESRLRGLGHDVFIDRHLTIGVEWAQEIEQRIREADAVVPLLSAASVTSEMLTYELQIARTAASKSGKPRILPVRVKFADAFAPDLALIMQPLQCFAWNGPGDDEKLLQHLRDTFKHPKREAETDRGPRGDGAMAPDCRYYVVRRTDQQMRAAIERRDATVLIKGARQTGKTSLLARGLKQVRDAGMRAVITDFQKLTGQQLEAPRSFYIALGELLADQLELDAHPSTTWNEKRAPNYNFDRFLRREILSHLDGPLVWALDEVDRLFSCPFGSEVFALFRTWHNERALDPSVPWSKLTLVIAYATEAHLFITDVNQSPFNVGTRLALVDFTIEQVAELNDRYGSPLERGQQMTQFFQLVSGHPFLVQRGLYELTAQGVTLEEFESRADQEDGPYGDHLRRALVMLAKDPQMLEVMRGLLRGERCPDADSFYRLRSAGIVTGTSASDAVPRCRLYQSYLRRHLL